MNYTDDINSQWQELCSIIESEIIRNLRAKNKVEGAALDATFETEKAKWNSNIDYRGAWLSTLAKNDSTLAGRIRDSLKGMKLTHQHGIHHPSSKLYMLVSALLIIGIIIVAMRFDIVLWKQLLGMALGGSAVITCSISIFNAQREKVKRKMIAFYRGQSQKFKKTLLSLEQKLDVSSLLYE